MQEANLGNRACLLCSQAMNTKRKFLDEIQSANPVSTQLLTDTKLQDEAAGDCT